MGTRGAAVFFGLFCFMLVAAACCARVRMCSTTPLVGKPHAAHARCIQAHSGTAAYGEGVCYAPTHAPMLCTWASMTCARMVALLSKVSKCDAAKLDIAHKLPRRTSAPWPATGGHGACAPRNTAQAAAATAGAASSACTCAALYRILWRLTGSTPSRLLPGAWHLAPCGGARLPPCRRRARRQQWCGHGAQRMQLLGGALHRLR